ncbi:MAG: ATP-binding protein [Clostridia bacterium]|nr:ATP-binding protein [Clostridia bacterium]
MNNNIKILLSQYDQKRTREINEAIKKREDFFDKYPEVEKLDHDISSLGIKRVQLILRANNKDEINRINKRIEELKNEKKSILKKLNLSEKDFEPVFECKKCSDTGYLSTPSGSILCPCIKQALYNLEYNDSNIYDLKNQNFSNFDLTLYSDEINTSKYNSKFSPRDNVKSIVKTCRNFINNFDDSKESNLLFCGSTGLGKTFLSSCIANELIKNGKTVLYQTAPIMLDKIIDYKFGKTDDDISKTIYSVDLLIIDDLGTETRNSLKITELFNIINSRLLNQNNKVTKTIISTNLSLQNLYDTYEERIVSRIIGNYNACYFFGDDIRMKKKMAIK